MRPAILFGAFDRHNLGDLLFPHVVGRLLGRRPFTLTGLVAADLRPWGGHRVLPLAEAIAGHGSAAVDLIHVGGEILTCSAWQAAIMTLAPAQAREWLRLPVPEAGRCQAWASEQLHCSRLAPYVFPASALPPGSRTLFLGTGGTGLPETSADLREEIVEALRQASFVGARDARTLAHLQAAGVAASLMPDTAVAATQLLAEDIRGHAGAGEPARVQERFPRGYVAVQFSADFGDDRTLDTLARQMEQIATPEGLAIVFLRTGSAPWHDDPEVYHRCAGRLSHVPCHVFESTHILDLCALIEGCRAWCGSSLHGWILAAGRPRVGLALPAAGIGGKLRAHVDTWTPTAAGCVVEPAGLAQAFSGSLNSPLPCGTDSAALTAIQALQQHLDMP